MSPRRSRGLMAMRSDPIARFDSRFSDPAAGPTAWPDAAAALERAELYWLTTVRADGRPHVTPLIGVYVDDAVHFCTGLREQKARNLEQNAHVALTTGTNTWAQGLDVVVEGTCLLYTSPSPRDNDGEPRALHADRLRRVRPPPD